MHIQVKLPHFYHKFVMFWKSISRHINQSLPCPAPVRLFTVLHFKINFTAPPTGTMSTPQSTISVESKAELKTDSASSAGSSEQVLPLDNKTESSSSLGKDEYDTP